MLVDTEIDELNRKADLADLRASPPLGARHLHLTAQADSGRVRWLVSRPGTALCGTPRCVPVWIRSL